MAASTRNIIHPIFEECKSFTLDPFWQEQFALFAANKFPSTMRYDANHKNLLIKLDGKKTEVIALPEDSPTETFQTMMQILKGRLGMRSTRDLKLEKQQMEEVVKGRVVDMDCEWKKIKPKHLRDQLIMNYIATLKEKYDLTLQEHRKLISTIQLGFQFKSLTPDDVEYADGEVTNIKGLVFNEDARDFDTGEAPMIAPKCEKPLLQNKFYTNLDRYYRDNSARTAKFRC